MECPAIAFNKGGPSEIIIDEKNGILCDDDDQYIRAIKLFNKVKFEKTFFQKYINRSFSVKKMLERFTLLINRL